jgi:hypothetical protein
VRTAVSYSVRFTEFLSKLPHSESLDDPGIFPDHQSKKRADFLLFDRSMIVEVKQLEVDPGYKADAIVAKFRNHPAYPLFFGKRALPDVLAHMPEELREQIRTDVFESVTRVITGYCEDGNRQIRNTRADLLLSAASGVLFILNDDIQVLTPDVLGARVEQQLHKKNADGSDRFPDLSYVVVFSWAHFLVGNNGALSHPIIVADGPGANGASIAKQQLDYVIHAWSHYSDARMGREMKATRELLERHVPATAESAPEKVTRQELWRMTYRKSPYLRPLTVEALLLHGNQVFADLAPHFLKHGVRSGDLMTLMERFAHFMEECEARNLDMRQFKPPIPTA